MMVEKFIKKDVLRTKGKEQDEINLHIIRLINKERPVT